MSYPQPGQTGTWSPNATAPPQQQDHEQTSPTLSTGHDVSQPTHQAPQHDAVKDEAPSQQPLQPAQSHDAPPQTAGDDESNLRAPVQQVAPGPPSLAQNGPPPQHQQQYHPQQWPGPHYPYQPHMYHPQQYGPPPGMAHPQQMQMHGQPPAYPQSPNGPPGQQMMPMPPPPHVNGMQPQQMEQYRNMGMPGQYPQYSVPAPVVYATQQPAPRQRTAIACSYCRRRKIRCSGFEQSEDGKCANCHRSNQTCVFTPVASQSPVFVPVHTVWRGQGGPPPQMYGAYGQPIPPGSIVPPGPAPAANVPQPGQEGQQAPVAPSMQQTPSQQQQQVPAPGPPHHYAPPPQTVPAQGEEQSNAEHPQSEVHATKQLAGQKRGHEDDHEASTAPPNPAVASQLSERSTDGQEQEDVRPGDAIDGQHEAVEDAADGQDLAQHAKGAMDNSLAALEQAADEQDTVAKVDDEEEEWIPRAAPS